MGKYITFSTPRKSKSGKTQIWPVVSDGGMELGQISWVSSWRKYAFSPAVYTVFEHDCLRQIAQFCEDESRNLRKTWRKA